jgi:hypothetical protein
MIVRFVNLLIGRLQPSPRTDSAELPSVPTKLRALLTELRKVPKD